MSSWLAQLDETLRATGVQVQEVPPVPAATLKAS
jgi:hypothetical protein